jgi:hypothetical protein
MAKFKNKYRGQTTRLQFWDYGAAAIYLIGLCTKDRNHFFGEVENEKMILTDIGKIAAIEWLKTPFIRPDMNLKLGEFIIMPDHFHGIISLLSKTF